MGDGELYFFALGLRRAEKGEQVLQRVATVEHLAAFAVLAYEDAAFGVVGRVAAVDKNARVTFHADKPREDTPETRRTCLHVDAICAGGNSRCALHFAGGDFGFRHLFRQTAVGVFEGVAKISAVDFHASDGVARLQGVALNKDLHLSVVLVGLYFEGSVHVAALHVFDVLAEIPDGLLGIFGGFAARSFKCSVVLVSAAPHVFQRVAQTKGHPARYVDTFRAAVIVVRRVVDSRACGFGNRRLPICCFLFSRVHVFGLLGV